MQYGKGLSSRGGSTHRTPVFATTRAIARRGEGLLPVPLVEGYPEGKRS